MNWELLCKHTEYPKLGYIIFRLHELGIRTRFADSSEHRLEVDAERIGDAWTLLGERHGRYELDDIRDDHPKFRQFANERPDEELA